MRNQQEAERAEQQRIKKLVLNYDLRAEEDEYGNGINGESDLSLYTLQPNLNRARGVPRSAAAWERASMAATKVSAGASASHRGTSSNTSNMQMTRQSDTATDTKSSNTGSIVQPSHERTGVSREYANAAAGAVASGETSHAPTAKPSSGQQSRGGSRRLPPATRKLQLSDVDW